MKELSKSIPRRLRDPNFMRRYFVGAGVDIGGKPDPLSLYREIFPLMGDVKVWDWDDGDAQFMASVPDNTFDFVNSSHCLEHLQDPVEGLRNWLRIVKPGGYVVALVPDEDLYEQGVWPSTNNLDHKHTFTILKASSWSPKSISLLRMFTELGADVRVEKVELQNATYRYALPRYDQTVTPIGECAIEFVLRKAGPEEVAHGGNILGTEQPPQDLRIHYNQYRDDYAAMKNGNSARPPFTNGDAL
jgi:SAM-dependent methyltransferase